MSAAVGAAAAKGGADLFGKIMEIRMQEKQLIAEQNFRRAQLEEAAKRRDQEQEQFAKQQLAAAFGGQQQAIAQGGAGLANLLGNVNASLSRTIHGMA